MLPHTEQQALPKLILTGLNIRGMMIFIKMGNNGWGDLCSDGVLYKKYSIQNFLG
jgi:hypothetical protein